MEAPTKIGFFLYDYWRSKGNCVEICFIFSLKSSNWCFFIVSITKACRMSETDERMFQFYQNVLTLWLMLDAKESSISYNKKTQNISSQMCFVLTIGFPSSVKWLIWEIFDWIHEFFLCFFCFEFEFNQFVPNTCECIFICLTVKLHYSNYSQLYYCPTNAAVWEKYF